MYGRQVEPTYGCEFNHSTLCRISWPLVLRLSEEVFTLNLQHKSVLEKINLQALAQKKKKISQVEETEEIMLHYVLNLLLQDQ